MKITAKQLRRIISEEAGRLNEMFTPIGGIGFGDIPRRPRSDFHELTLVDQAYDDLVNEADDDDKASPVPVIGTSLEDRIVTLEKRMNALAEQLDVSARRGK